MFVSNDRLRRLVKNIVPLEGIRRSDKRLRIAATNWHNGSVQIFENANLDDEVGHQIILASASIPGLTRPVIIGGTAYVDGGVGMNTPLLPALEAGADPPHAGYPRPE